LFDDQTKVNKKCFVFYSS